MVTLAIRRLTPLFVSLLALGPPLVGQALAHETGQHAAKDYNHMWRERLEKAPQNAVSLSFDAQGRLWLARAAGKYVVVSHSDDVGRNFSPAVKVNREAEMVDGNGENRPKIAVAGGRVYISWTQSLPQPFSGHVRFAVSGDGGKSFSAPVTINSDLSPLSHRFDALLADASGRVTLAWLDGRERARQKDYRGAAVYVAESRDGGVSFAANRKLADHSCECCRIALAAMPAGIPVAFWRQIFDDRSRDFAVAAVASPDAPQQTPRRASEDGWKIDACPHHGGDMSIDGEGGWHIAWFTGAEKNPGLFYRRIDGERMTTPRAFGNLEAQPGHPAVYAIDKKVFLAWQEFDGKTTSIRLMTSIDRGETWSMPRTAAITNGAADYPLLVAGQGKVWLAWNSVVEGLRLFDAAQQP